MFAVLPMPIRSINNKNVHYSDYKEVLGNDPMSMIGLRFLGFHLISDKNHEDEVELEGWIGRSGTPSRSVRLVTVFLPPPFSLLHGQVPMHLTKHGLWRRDPHELHFSASASR